MDDIGYDFRIAVASSDGIVVNSHFGRAEKFYIYEVKAGEKEKLIEKRTLKPVCNGGNHDDKQLFDNVTQFKDCKYVLVSKIGMGAAQIMEQMGIVPMELPGMIEESIEKLIVYEQLQNLF